ncbi:MAG TPA: hypothetical protein K8V51_02140 [Campylobacter avium]|uniref:hypothetical protein n=1 Tax=Campylobacter avium TaxID=522485 RepID=UPI001D8720A5|nr:hypothetical protein [Campylobacter avium]HJE65846.1 hypothetical protein [Campylobacter avium]
MEKYNVRIFYSMYCEYEIEAQNEEEAILQARNFEIDSKEIIANLESWEEADEATQVRE